MPSTVESPKPIAIRQFQIQKRNVEVLCLQQINSLIQPRGSGDVEFHQKDLLQRLGDEQSIRRVVLEV